MTILGPCDIFFHFQFAWVSLNLWICEFIPFISFGKLLAIISSYIVSFISLSIQVFSFIFSGSIRIVDVQTLHCIHWVSLALFLFFPEFFFFSLCLVWKLSVDHISDSLILFSVFFFHLWLNSSMNFRFQVCFPVLGSYLIFKNRFRFSLKFITFHFVHLCLSLQFVLFILYSSIAN